MNNDLWTTVVAGVLVLLIGGVFQMVRRRVLRVREHVDGLVAGIREDISTVERSATTNDQSIAEVKRFLARNLAKAPQDWLQDDNGN